MSEYGILSCCGPCPALAQWFKVMGWIKYLEIKPNEIVMFPFVRAQEASELFTQFAISNSGPENWPHIVRLYFLTKLSWKIVNCWMQRNITSAAFSLLLVAKIKTFSLSPFVKSQCASVFIPHPSLDSSFSISLIIQASQWYSCLWCFFNVFLTCAFISSHHRVSVELPVLLVPQVPLVCL